MTDEAQLAAVDQHVVEAERIIARQIHAIAMLKLRGVDTTEAEQRLGLLKESLKAFRRYRDSILENLGPKEYASCPNATAAGSTARPRCSSATAMMRSGGRDEDLP